MNTYATTLRQSPTISISEAAISLFSRHVDDAARLIGYAQSGSHLLNPYHNLIHELQVVYWSNAILVNDPSFKNPEDWKTRNILLTAALFHDHNHSGGVYDDRKNIQRATKAAQKFIDRNISSEVVSLINVTEFYEGKFTYRPTTLSERIIRDADLCSIYSEEGRLLLLGLSEELGGKPVAKMTNAERVEHCKKNADFLRSAEMFTEHGVYLKETQLERALKAYETLVLEQIDNLWDVIGDVTEEFSPIQRASTVVEPE